MTDPNFSIQFLVQAIKDYSNASSNKEQDRITKAHVELGIAPRLKAAVTLYEQLTLLFSSIKMLEAHWHLDQETKEINDSTDEEKKQLVAYEFANRFSSDNEYLDVDLKALFAWHLYNLDHADFKPFINRQMGQEVMDQVLSAQFEEYAEEIEQAKQREIDASDLMPALKEAMELVWELTTSHGILVRREERHQMQQKVSEFFSRIASINYEFLPSDLVKPTIY